MKTTEYSYLTGSLSYNGLILIFTVTFFILGIILSKKYFFKEILTRQKSNEINWQKIENLQISKREYEVLQLIAKGNSNKEIGELLFVSENTIKTHISSLLLKLQAKRRTQAINIATEKGIL